MNKKAIASFIIVILIIGAGLWLYKNETPKMAPVNPDAVVRWKEHPVLGPYLIDSRGFTLYTYNLDPALKSRCSGACAKQWPPFEFNNKDTSKINDALTQRLNVLKRDDGMMQFAYEDQPLYYFLGDTHAGEVFGNGVNDQWSIVKVD